MKAEHLIRTLGVVLGALAILGTWLYLGSTGGDPAQLAKLEGMLYVLAPAAADTLRVARKERKQRRAP